MKGYLHSIETMGAVDGPGIRTVAFLQGCPARCIYCHNPDTWEKGKGKIYEPSQIVELAKRYQPYYGTQGGVTFSGGEPLLQGEFIIKCMEELKAAGIQSIIDTSGTYFDGFTSDAIELSQLILLDVKHSDPQVFQNITALPQDNLLKIIDVINKKDKPVWIRQVVIPGINDTKENIKELNQFIKTIKHVQKVELLGYHNLGKDKWQKMNKPYQLKDTSPMNAAKLNELSQLLQW